MTPSERGEGSAQAGVGFTPGPWSACNMVHAERGDQMTPEEIGEYVAGNVRLGSPDRFLFITTGGDGDPDICHIGNGPAGPANANLISAAPDMYEALKYAANALTAMRPSFSAVKDEGHAFHDQVLDAVNAALAKAEGR